MSSSEPEARCPAITFAGKPGQLLVRCKLTAGHTRDHIPDLEEMLGD